MDVGVHHHYVTFAVPVCLPAIFKTCFSYDKDIWIDATDCDHICTFT